MCGIIGIIARDMVASGLLEGLRRLEYRGYDSAGIAHPRLANGDWPDDCGRDARY